MLKSHTTKISVQAVGAAVSVSTLAAAVAFASRNPLSGARAAGSRLATVPLTVVVLLLAAAALTGLAGLIWLAWPAPRRRARDLPLVASRIQVPWVVKLLALVGCLGLAAAVLAAALIAGDHVSQPQPQLRLGGVPGRPGPAPRATGHGAAVPAWLPWVIVGILAATAVAAIWAVRQGSRSGPAPPPAEGERSTAAVDAAIAGLESSADPRRAVIAAYFGMEQALAVRGLPRAPAEAPREYLERVLADLRAGERETETLTALFEKARFSDHPVSERARDRARTTLGRLRARLKADAR